MRGGRKVSEGAEGARATKRVLQACPLGFDGQRRIALAQMRTNRARALFPHPHVRQP